MSTFEREFQLHSPTEPEFQLVPPKVESVSTVETVREPQLDFSELFGAVALFSVNHHGKFDIEAQEAA